MAASGEGWYGVLMRRRSFALTLFAASGILAGCQGPIVGNAPLATGQLGILAMAVDDFFLYWVVDTGAVRRVSLDGGAVETLAQAAAGPASIALDETHVFFTTGGGDVVSVPKKGGDTKVLATAVSVGNVAVDDTFVYFTAGNVVKRVSKEGTDAADLATDEVSPGGLVVRATLIWAATGTTGPAAKAGAIRQVDLSGGTAKNVIPNISPRTLSVTQTRLVWTEGPTGQVRAANIDGTDLRDVAVLEGETIGNVIADEDNAYFATDLGTLRVVSLAPGSTPEIMVTGKEGGIVMTSDAFYVYMANNKSGAILALSKALHTTAPLE